MDKLVGLIIKVIGYVALALGGFLLGWLFRAVKAKRQIKGLNTKKEEE